MEGEAGSGTITTPLSSRFTQNCLIWDTLSLKPYHNIPTSKVALLY